MRGDADALDAARRDPAGAAERCAALSLPDLRADCTLAAAERLARRDGPAAAALCDALPTGTARDECFFQVAERGGADCDRAGAFAADCRMHRWSRELEEMLPEDPRPVEVLDELRRAMREAGLDPGADEPWWAAWRAVLARGRPFDRAACRALADARLAALCAGAGRQLYGDWLAHLRDTGTLPCAGPATGRLAHTPDPELDAMLAAARAEAGCP